MPYTVISFNLRNIYASAMDRDWNAVAEILRTERADIVAVQEIFSELPIKHLCRRLNVGFLSDWRYRMVSRQTCQNGRGEGYAILWNARRVDLSPIVKVSESGARMVVGWHEPEIRTEWSRSLMRPPCVARFIPVGWCVPFIELRVIATHIIWEENAYLRGRGNGLTDKALRKEEYRALSERLFPRVGKNRTSGDFRPAYTFIVGDYNLYVEDCAQIDALPKSEVQFMKTRQILGSTIYPGKDEKDPGGYTENDYDHVSYSDREHPHVQIVERIDAPDKYYESDFKKYQKRMSDHVPIKMLFDVRHVNPEPISTTIIQDEGETR